MLKKITAIAIVTALATSAAFSQSYKLDIDLKKAGAPIQNTMYGIFFEDINFAADGGLYAELVKNRSFEFPCDALQGWKAFGKVEVRNDGPFPRAEDTTTMTARALRYLPASMPATPRAANTITSTHPSWRPRL